jgi:hypothetical protein
MSKDFVAYPLDVLSPLGYGLYRSGVIFEGELCLKLGKILYQNSKIPL